jgi:adenylate cyclase
VERQHEERRLTTILSADVAGYSRLMAADESGTLAQLKAQRKELIGPKTAEYSGRVVKLMGDGTLMEFGSVVDAVSFAVDVQQAMAERNAKVPEDRQIIYRIGINIGDIIVEGEDIYGDGVNVAARLEGLAEPGGICISAKVHDEVANKLALSYEDLGAQGVKNIAEPIRVYRIAIDAPWAQGMPRGGDSPPLPDKPSIAVLPFENMSGDPEQEYFSDGITEDIITELSRFRSLFVIARNSSFAYKGQSINVGKIGQELGVQYVVEGSVRKAGNRVRVTAQLVEAESGNHLWAEHYDRDLEDIFAVQDEVARTIVATVAGRVDDAGAERTRRRPTSDMAAYDYLLRANSHAHRYTRGDTAKARSYIEKAIELDPEIARAYALLANFDVWDWFWAGGGGKTLDGAWAQLQKAIALDDHASHTYAVCSLVCIHDGRQDEALTYAERAFKLNPNDLQSNWLMAWSLESVGRHQEAFEWIEKAMRLDPFYPDVFYEIRAISLYSLGRYEEAVATYGRVKKPAAWVHRGLVAAYAQLGRLDDARRAFAALEETIEQQRREGDPDASVEWILSQAGHYYKNEDDREHEIDGLRKAGLDV